MIEKLSPKKNIVDIVGIPLAVVHVGNDNKLDLPVAVAEKAVTPVAVAEAEAPQTEFEKKL